MKMYVWTDGLCFLAVAQAESVATARTLVLQEMGESGDGSCPERDKARAQIVSSNPTVYYGLNAEFALTDNAGVRELEAYISRNKINQRPDAPGQEPEARRILTLASAAPEMYDALDAFTDGTTRDWTNRMANARAALAKARGEGASTIPDTGTDSLHGFKGGKRG